MDTPYLDINYRVLIYSFPEIVGLLWARLKTYMQAIGKLPLIDANYWVKYFLVNDQVSYVRQEYNYKFETRWTKVFRSLSRIPNDLARFYITRSGSMVPAWLNFNRELDPSWIPLNQVKKMIF